MYVSYTLFSGGNCAALQTLDPWHRKLVTSMATLMSRVGPIKHYYLGTNTFINSDKGEFKDFRKLGYMKGLVTFEDRLYNSRLDVEKSEHRVIPWSLTNPLKVLITHLDALDSIRPYDKNPLLAKTLLRPSDVFGSVGSSRLWETTHGITFRQVTGALLTCLGEKTQS
eukprot:Blabericola_migrator_1__7635@NODE_38_length_17790_cov_195_231733_g34_i0_p10_GENE_NODE_38_length_17790_cov_195_231733_g34_i0NODE_38_length_17790_cov_195_231733_g34_i0_p10_ORF_typecomplete_len168_score31_10_NODE_38_length_17790_cov_195_231733_g34_i01006110564